MNHGAQSGFLKLNDSDSFPSMMKPPSKKKKYARIKVLRK